MGHGSRFVIPFKNTELDLNNRTVVMAILNMSPESPVSQSVVTPEQAIERATQLRKEGAIIIDVGGHSSSSKAEDIDTEEEIDRVIPVIQALVREGFLVSLDSWNPTVAREAAKVGVHLLNDINGLQNPEMVEVARQYDLPVCVMHMRGKPKEHYRVDQTYPNITRDVLGWLNDRVDELTQAGIKREKIILDPGYEFGKSLNDNLQLLWDSPQLLRFGLPILVSASRKAFIAEAVGIGRKQEGEGLLEGSMAVQTLSALFGAHILRVHDVRTASYIVQFMNKLRHVAMSRSLGPTCAPNN